VAILDATLTLYKRVMDDPSLQKVAKMTEGFSGAELAALVPDALFTAFADGERDLNVRDLLAAASSVKPLSETAKEKITKMREWSVGRARPASTPTGTTESTATTGRTLDI
jgi:SpoVK/Ycf46/Vps4 family AAA+-type ATPase